MSNTTDREQLELAAKAMGLRVISFAGDRGLWVLDADEEWSPLTDDGDALRLAVKLRIDFKCFAATVRTWVGDPVAQRVIASIEEPCGEDPYAAARRAIVCAAAEIGRQMP